MKSAPLKVPATDMLVCPVCQAPVTVTVAVSVEVDSADLPTVSASGKAVGAQFRHDCTPKTPLYRGLSAEDAARV